MGRTALHVLVRGSLTAMRYRDEILRPPVRPYAGAVGPGLLLMQDNARPHVAGVCQQFLQPEGIDVINRPAWSPDLNPIEHIWDIMSRSIHQRQVAPQSVQELVDALVRTSAVSSGACPGVVESCRARDRRIGPWERAEPSCHPAAIRPLANNRCLSPVWCCITPNSPAARLSAVAKRIVRSHLVMCPSLALSAVSAHPLRDVSDGPQKSCAQNANATH
ncbi:hypothetical protein WMY93_019611 [Mugilogobius chulae]|uniref:Tc1-like transposase DDE domain-containing protein n=1 Tax=Mugilogobius chulae TaxID=88201 RepID=A0AAW0NHM1_9GOBI